MLALQANITKYLTVALAILPTIVFAETFTSDNFIIDIERGCGEGVVTCDIIRFRYSAVGTEQVFTAIGKAVDTHCADAVGLSPCRVQGYEFLADGAKYFIHDSGVLEISDSEGKQLLVELGKWQ